MGTFVTGQTGSRPERECNRAATWGGDAEAVMTVHRVIHARIFR